MWIAISMQLMKISGIRLDSSLISYPVMPEIPMYITIEPYPVTLDATIQHFHFCSIKYGIISLFQEVMNL